LCIFYVEESVLVNTETALLLAVYKGLFQKESTHSIEISLEVNKSWKVAQVEDARAFGLDAAVG